MLDPLDEMFVDMFECISKSLGEHELRVTVASYLILRDGPRILQAIEGDDCQFPGLTRCVEIAGLVGEAEEIIKAMREGERATFQ